MNSLLSKIPDIIQLICIGLTILMIVATFIARLTKSKADDDFVANCGSKLMKVLQWLPTIGVNPRTKELESAYVSLKIENAELKAQADGNPPPAA